MESALSLSSYLQALHLDNKKQRIQIEHNRIKNPHLTGGSRLANIITSVAKDLNSELSKSSSWTEWDVNLGLLDCESNMLATQPRCLHIGNSIQYQSMNSNIY